ncbi:PKS-NRPS hybrid synthetase CHGG_01239-like [Camellia sinensis]|uniref:PKS-NRPS hybrid synthetase CHGG_01239-like n=1 Tax=Camellia sinensis TaxID=4442 RepID=UPI0010369BCB|nr:PKS-NRPS hybrid synthetase CHGG_01239-like [Camellia sinensis]
MVTDLFWAHPVSLELLRAFPHVLIMDCTYKTNRYRLPLLEIIGVTSTDLTFSVAFAYLGHEREDNYTWALDVLRTVMKNTAFPKVIITDRELALMTGIAKVLPMATNILCRWHISKNVLMKCKKVFETKDKWDKFMHSWSALVLVRTETEFNEQFSTMKTKFSTYPEAIKYVTTNWLEPYKEKFVAAWTDSNMHFGNTTTNRVESSHAKLKRQLGSSQGSFKTSWTKIHNLLELQHADIKASFQQSLIVVQHNYTPVEFTELRGFISICSLDKILVESKRLNSVGIDVVACGCILRRTHGLPCAHEIAEYFQQGRPIPLSCINPHWRKLDMLPVSASAFVKLDCKTETDFFIEKFQTINETQQVIILKKLRELISPDSTFLMEPELKTDTRRRGRGRGRGQFKIDTSTKREPSAFEFVLSEEDSYSQGVTISTAPVRKQVQRKKAKKDNVCMMQSTNRIYYFEQFLEKLRPYIRHIKDVQADGEDDWQQVRRNLLTELHSNVVYYVQLFGSQERVDELNSILSYFESSPGYNHWMTMPDMGHLIASYYRVVLYHLSMQQCLTFLPLRSVPIATPDRRDICIGFVYLQPGHPVPPIANN